MEMKCGKCVFCVNDNEKHYCFVHGLDKSVELENECSTKDDKGKYFFIEDTQRKKKKRITGLKVVRKAESK